MDLVYWLMLLKTPQVGVRRFYQALKYFKDPKSVFSASNKERKDSGIFTEKSLNFLATATTDIVANDISWHQQDNCHIITFIDNKYPEKLKHISDPPPILYIHGNIELLQQKQFAIVGSRNPTTGGASNAYDFAKTLSSQIIITSGMAIGIDIAAHLGALEQNQPTIAVCATGLDRVYPSKHKNFAKQIAITGALVSELPIGTKPIGSNFPRRNRIISGMSDGILIVEASIKSGSMLSAKSALEQNRDVFAIPGSIKNPLSAGPHQLIKEGAILTDSADDIIKELNLTPLNDKIKNSKELTINKNVLLKYLDYDGMTIDEIIIKSKLDAQDVVSNLLELELLGLITKQYNNSYILK